MLQGKFDGIKFKDSVLYDSGEIKVEDCTLVLIAGANGTGKSLLLKQLYMKNMNHGVYIEQDCDLILPHLTLEENIKMGQDNIKTENIIHVLKKLDMLGLLKKKVGKISGGEERVICLLRGILSNADYIFMDEPTNDLDYRIVDVLIDLIDTLKKEKTFLVVTHDERMYKIADRIYVIDNKRIELKKEADNQIQRETKKYRNRMLIEKNTFFQKIFKIDNASVFLFFLLTLISLMFIVDSNKEISVISTEVKDNQVTICNTLYASPRQLLNDGYIPTTCLKYLNAENIGEWNLSKVENEIVDCINRAYSLNLEIDNSDKYDVYNIEYYDASNDTFSNVLTMYLDTIEESDKDVYLDTSESFVIDKYFWETQGMEANDGKKVCVELDKLKKIEEVIVAQGKNAPCLSIVLLDEQLSFYDFIEDDQIKELREANYYIKSSETCQLLREANQYIKLKKNNKRFLGITIVLIIVDIFNAFINVKIKKKTVRILRDYGFKLDVVQKQLLRRYSIKMPSVVACILIALTNIWICAMKANCKTFSCYLFALIYMSAVSFCFLFRKYFWVKSVNNVYSDEER